MEKKKSLIKVPDIVPLSYEEKTVHVGFEEKTNPWLIIQSINVFFIRAYGGREELKRNVQSGGSSTDSRTN